MVIDFFYHNEARILDREISIFNQRFHQKYAAPSEKEACSSTVFSL